MAAVVTDAPATAGTTGPTAAGTACTAAPAVASGASADMSAASASVAAWQIADTSNCQIAHSRGAALDLPSHDCSTVK